MKWIFILLALMPSFLNAQEINTLTDEYSLDLFTGSIEMKDGVLIMRRCNIGDTEYILRPSPKAKINFVKTLQEKKLDPKNTTTLIAHYIEIGDKHGLEIFEIAEIKQNQNCHLMDLF